MKFQIVLWSCLLFAATGSFANPQSHVEKDAEQSDDLKELFSELSDTTAKWNSLQEKFEKLQRSECSWPANDGLCKSIQEQVNRLKAKPKDDEDPREGEAMLIHNVLSSLQRKVERLDRETEAGRPVSADYADKVKEIKEALGFLHMKVMGQAKGAKSPMMYLYASEDDSLEGGNQWVSDADDIQGFKHLGKTCKMLINPYKKLLTTVHRLDGAVETMNRKSASCYQRLDGLGAYHSTTVRNFNYVSNKIESLWKMTSREVSENRKILKSISKKIDLELSDDDKDDEDLKNSLKRFMVEQRKEIQKTIKKALSRRNSDDDDSDDDDSRRKGRRRSKNDDTDDDTDDDSDDDDSRGKGRRRSKNDDTDDDSDDDDDDSREKGKRRSKDDTDDDSDDDDDSREKGKRKSKDDTDDDSDDDDDDNNTRRKNKKKSKGKVDDDSDDDDTDESCGDSDGCDRMKKKGKDTDESDEDDDDDDDDDNDDDDKRKGRKMSRLTPEPRERRQVPGSAGQEPEGRGRAQIRVELSVVKMDDVTLRSPST